MTLGGLGVSYVRGTWSPQREREFFINNLLVRIHSTNEMIWRTGLSPWEFEFLFPGSIVSTFQMAPMYNGSHSSNRVKWQECAGDVRKFKRCLKQFCGGKKKGEKKTT